MRPDIVRLFACPVCGESFAEDDASLLCPAGHRFDVARQGYVSLLGGGGATAGAGDTAAMVDARRRFLGAGHFHPLTDAVVEVVRECLGDRSGVVVDLGAGTGQHLAAVLDALPSAVGVALDVSKYAARAAARSHPRLGAVVCDVWRTLPVQSGVADVVLDIFAPRNAGEIVRTLRPGGAFVLVTPTVEHLHELVGPLGLVTVDPDKGERVDRDLAALTLQRRTPVQWTVELGRDAVRALVEMGPTAHHLEPGEVAGRMSGLPERVTVTCAVDVSVYSSG